MYADVLIEYNVKSIDKTFTYIIPKSMNAKIGMKVKVPFGKKTINGFIVDIKDNYDSDYDLKEIVEIVDENFVLNDELLLLGDYLHTKTLCTKIMAFQTMLPSSLKVKDQKRKFDKYVSYIELNSEKSIIDSYISETRSKKQVELLQQLLMCKRLLKNEVDSNVCKKLVENGLVKVVKEHTYRINPEIKDRVEIKLSNEQGNAINSVALNEERTYLLHGVTGSGKTQVYIELIKKVVKNGKTALLLVPEISLTTQIIQKFYDNFGNDVAIFHSGLSDGEKYDEYLKIFNNEVHIVIGTRSAIFTPITNLGIIIIDEEHSETYKQDTNPRYHAIDMAKFRCNYHSIPLVLGSATPSLETMARALKGVYTYIKMENRIGDAVLPEIEIVDQTDEVKNGNYIISKILRDKIMDRLDKKEQVILLLNRRGYSTIISCKACGYTYKCPHCDISLTYHKSSNNLRCHYCGYTVFKTDKCPECGENALYDYGLGTEKLEQEIAKVFPMARIVRMDADTTTNKGAYSKIINSFRDYEYDILLGTQMISKGLDFPLVTLVGVLNADATLNIPDFRSGERTFALLSQTSGRAGRGQKRGEVILQTFNPNSFVLKCVCDNDYMKFYNYEMSNRHKLSYPPYYFLISLKIASKEYDLASTEISKVKKYLENHLSKDIIILGPTVASIFKIKNVYRFQIILKYKKENGIFDVLKELDNIYAFNNKVNLEIDNNPLQL